MNSQLFTGCYFLYGQKQKIKVLAASSVTDWVTWASELNQNWITDFVISANILSLSKQSTWYRDETDDLELCSGRNEPHSDVRCVSADLSYYASLSVFQPCEWKWRPVKREKEEFPSETLRLSEVQRSRVKPWQSAGSETLNLQLHMDAAIRQHVKHINMSSVVIFLSLTVKLRLISSSGNDRNYKAEPPRCHQPH